MSSKNKKLDQHVNDMFISELEKEESLQNVISKIYKNQDPKNESFRRLSELFGMCLRHIGSQEFSKNIIIFI